MTSDEFKTYCAVRGIEHHPELFKKYEDDFFQYTGDNDDLFYFIRDLIKYESGKQEDHIMFTICAVLRCIMTRAKREKAMTYYWAAKLATKMAKRMSRRLEEYKRDQH